MSGYLLEPQSLSMNTRINTCAVSEISSPPVLRKSDSLFDATEQFQNYPGITNVEAVRFEDGDEIKFRFRLTTEIAVSPAASVIHKQEFEEDEIDVDCLFLYYEGKEHVQCVQDLRHLIERATGFAYLTGQQELQRHSVPMAARQEKSLERLWHTEHFDRISDVLTNRTELFSSWKDEDGIEVTLYRLPCGHVEHFTSVDFHSKFIDKAACQKYACPKCRQPVVISEDEVSFGFVIENYLRREWQKKTKYYQALEDKIKSHKYTPFTVREKDFKGAIQKALNSLILPSSVAPRSQNPVMAKCTKEAGVVINALNKYFSRGNDQLTVAALLTLPTLLRISIGALQDYHGVSILDQSGIIFNIAHINIRQFLTQWSVRSISLTAEEVGKKQKKKTMRKDSTHDSESMYCNMLHAFDGLHMAKDDATDSDMFI